jgi:tetratricopeptide (TPR) repeat protein
MERTTLADLSVEVTTREGRNFIFLGKTKMSSGTVSKTLATLALAWTTFMPVTDGIAATVNNNSCNQEWERVLRQFPRPQDRLREWSSLSAKCANSGIYESRLGTLYTIAHRFDEARRAVEAGLALNTSYRKELLSTLAGVDLSESKLDAALATYQTIAKDYPDWFDGYSGIGTVEMLRGKFDEAVRYLNEANKREKRAYTYRNLTLAYHQLGKNEEATQSINEAYKLDKNIVADREVMVAAARSYAFLGKYKAADGFMKMLLEAKPEARNDPEVVQTINYVSKKLRETPND